MATLHIWETNFRNYSKTVVDGSSYTYEPPAYAGFRLKSVSLNGIALYPPYTFLMPTGYADLVAAFALDTPPPPPPPNSGSGDGERVGYCTLKGYQAFGQTWYRVMHDDGETIVSGVDFASAKYKASKSDRCKEAPLSPPPSTAAPGPEAIADAVAAKLAPVTGGLKQDTTSLLETAGTTLAVGTINYNMLGWIRNSALPALQETANNIYGRLESVPAQIIEFRNSALSRIDDVKVLISNLPRFDVAADIVTPITGAMPNLGKIHGWIDGFSWPAWNTVIVQPISNIIDAKISAMFGIDPALPFWGELEKKIIALAIRSVDAILDAVIPDPPEES